MFSSAFWALVWPSWQLFCFVLVLSMEVSKCACLECLGESEGIYGNFSKQYLLHQTAGLTRSKKCSPRGSTRRATKKHWYTSIVDIMLAQLDTAVFKNTVTQTVKVVPLLQLILEPKRPSSKKQLYKIDIPPSISQKLNILLKLCPEKLFWASVSYREYGSTTAQLKEKSETEFTKTG